MDQTLSDSAQQAQACSVPGCHGSLFVYWHDDVNKLQLACIFDPSHPHRDLTKAEQAGIHPISKIKSGPDCK